MRLDVGIRTEVLDELTNINMHRQLFLGNMSTWMCFLSHQQSVLCG